MAPRQLRHLAIAATLHAFVGYGLATWNAPFLVRSHGMGQAEIGLWLAGVGSVFGVLGTYLGGYLADRLGPRDARWAMWVPGVSTPIAVPFAIACDLAPDVRTAVLFAGVPVFFGAMYLGPTFSITQALAPLRMRAVASAFLLFLINLIEGVVACTTAISTIHGTTLVYRGYTIEDLAANATFEEVVYLLWFGRLPTRKELARFQREPRRRRWRCRPSRSAGSTGCRPRSTRWTSCTPSSRGSRSTIRTRT